MNILDRKFSVAPMMDWTGTPQNAKRNLHLRVGAVGHAVPNAVPLH
jgi:tRNA-dihydrouridine synthase